MEYVRHYTFGCMVEWTAYSPPFALFTPKLLPTTPLQRQDWPAALVHDAVAVAPTFRHDIARLSRAGDADTRVAKRAARERLRSCMMDCRSDKSSCCFKRIRLLYMGHTVFCHLLWSIHQGPIVKYVVGNESCWERKEYTQDIRAYIKREDEFSLIT
jgi:hypothetical protein